MPLNPANQEKFIQLLDSVLPEASKSLSLLLNSSINLSFGEWSDADIASPIIYSLEFTKPANNSLSIIASSKLAWMLADLMTGGAAAYQEGAELDAEKQSAYSEALSQSMNAIVAKLRSKAAMDMHAGAIAAATNMNNKSSFKMNIHIEGLADEIAYFEISQDLMRFLLDNYAGGYTDDNQERGIAGVEFAQVNPNGTQMRGNEDRNLNLLMDIRMGLTVELGRSEMPLKDILKLAKGSVIELDRLSGEPVDLFVNNKLIARGEVVVIDDNFGLRITQLAGNLNLAHDMGLMAVAAD